MRVSMLASLLAQSAATELAFQRGSCAGRGARVPCGRAGNGVQPSEGFDAQQCASRGCCVDEALEACWMPFVGEANVTTVHLIQSNHFDAGYTDGLVNVINQYFTQYFPRAAKLGKELREAGGKERLIWMTQAYLVSLYLECPANTGLQCPDESELAAFNSSVTAGDITWHAFPQNAEYMMMDADLLQFGVSMTHDLDDRFGLPRKVTVSDRDVPGFERSVIPLLKKAGVKMLSEGMNGRIYPVNVPPAFVWRDASNLSINDRTSPKGFAVVPPSGEDILAIWHPKGYGGLGDYVTVPGLSHALAYDWRGDNQGPPTSADEVKAGFATVRKAFPGAKVIASTLDAFAAELEKVKDSLPVVTGEIGDSWIWGVGSDPIKTQRMRALTRQRTRCVSDGTCPAALAVKIDPDYYNMSRLLVKGSEHTWGISVSNFGSFKEKGWSNQKFHDNRLNGESFVSKFETEWKSQMSFAVDRPLAAIADSASKAAKAVASGMALEEADMKPQPVDPKSEGFTQVSTGEVLKRVGGWCDFGIDASSGAVTTLVDHGSGDSVIWATSSNPLALQRYQSLTEEDYAAWRKEYLITDCEWEYGKPGQDSEAGWKSQHQLLPPNVSSLWLLNASHSAQVLMHLTFPDSLNKDYGAPAGAWVRFTFEAEGPRKDRGLIIKASYSQKTTTRLGEAMFVTMNPPDEGANRSWWALDKLGEWVSPMELVDGAPRGLHGISTGVKFARLAADGTQQHVFFESLDAAMVAFDTPTPFPTPIHGQPDMKQGASFVLWNNIWNTNYIFWWPYDMPQNETSADIVFRFGIRFLTTTPSPAPPLPPSPAPSPSPTPPDPTPGQCTGDAECEVSGDWQTSQGDAWSCTQNGTVLACASGADKRSGSIHGLFVSESSGHEGLVEGSCGKIQWHDGSWTRTSELFAAVPVAAPNCTGDAECEVTGQWMTQHGGEDRYMCTQTGNEYSCTKAGGYQKTGSVHGLFVAEASGHQGLLSQSCSTIHWYDGGAWNNVDMKHTLLV